jgi:hypothetical protein
VSSGVLDIFIKVELPRFVHGLNVGMSKKTRVKNDSAMVNISAWTVVTNTQQTRKAIE